MYLLPRKISHLTLITFFDFTIWNITNNIFFFLSPAINSPIQLEFHEKCALTAIFLRKGLGFEIQNTTPSICTMDI